MLSAFVIFLSLVAAFSVGFAIGLKFGRHNEREAWRVAVVANLKRWRQEFMQEGEVQDSWLGGK